MNRRRLLFFENKAKPAIGSRRKAVNSSGTLLDIRDRMIARKIREGTGYMFQIWGSKAAVKSGSPKPKKSLKTDERAGS